MISYLTLLAALISQASGFITPSLTFIQRETTHLNMSTEETLAIKAEDTALVFIEYQNEFTSEDGALHGAVKECMEATGTIENSKKVMDEARGAGCTIIHLPITFEEGHSEISKKPYGILAGIKEGELFKSGTWGAKICDTMTPSAGDIIAKGKNGLCGFASTNLDFLLRQNQVKNVVLAGFLTNCCVESTMRSAYELGYNVYTLKDCCAATSIEGQNAAYEHTFGMFSVPTTSTELMAGLKC
jgi:nicotinamidase-related amidase